MAIAADIQQRPFVTAGFLALVARIPLTVTSTDAMVWRLGARRCSRCCWSPWCSPRRARARAAAVPRSAQRRAS
jgi:hypothetical protein